MQVFRTKIAYLLQLRMYKTLGFLICLLCLGCRPRPHTWQDYFPPDKLKGTSWESDFYHYHNNYFFKTDSTGYSEDGQLAWSCPIDTVALHISGDSILILNKSSFTYTLKDTLLMIRYTDPHHAETDTTRTFYMEKDLEGVTLVSLYEYTYGREVLRKKGNKAKRR